MMLSPVTIAASIRIAFPTPPPVCGDPLVGHGERMVRDIMYGCAPRSTQTASVSSTPDPLTMSMLRDLDDSGSFSP